MQFAETELRRAGLDGTDLGKAILELIEVFDGQAHSGTEARRVVELFSKLALHEPLIGVTGGDDEWIAIDDGYYQNKRCSDVFKKGIEGRPYYTKAIVWQTRGWACATGWNQNTDPGLTYDLGSSQYIKSFPFIPKTFAVDVIYQTCVRVEDSGYCVVDKEQLKPIFEYYSDLNFTSPQARKEVRYER